MTTRKVKFKGGVYPMELTMLAFRNWERLTGRKMSDVGELLKEGEAISASNLVDLLTLIHCGIVDSCEDEGIEFPFTLNKFVRQCTPAEIQELTASISIEVPESENTGQPLSIAE